MSAPLAKFFAVAVALFVALELFAIVMTISAPADQRLAGIGFILIGATGAIISEIMRRICNGEEI